MSTSVLDPATGQYAVAERDFYDGADLILVTDAAGDVASRYLYGPGADGNDQAVAADTGEDGSAMQPGEPATTRWYVADRQGTVTDVLNADGVVVDHLTYDTYGAITGQTQPAEQPRFGFQGMEIDQAAGAVADGAEGSGVGTDTGMYYDNARFYEPGTGRFLNQDPMGLSAGNPDLYGFVGNDPTGATDPSGMDPLLGGQSLTSQVGYQPYTIGNTPASASGSGPITDSHGQPIQIVDSDPNLGVALAMASVLDGDGLPGQQQISLTAAPSGSSALGADYQRTAWEYDQILAATSGVPTLNGLPMGDAYADAQSEILATAGDSTAGDQRLQAEVMMADAQQYNQFDASKIDQLVGGWAQRGLNSATLGITDGVGITSTGSLPAYTQVTPAMSAALNLGLFAVTDGASELLAAEEAADVGVAGVDSASDYIGLGNVGCFRPGTVVLSGIGEHRPIESVGIGRRVATPESSADRPGRSIDPAAQRVVRLHVVKDGQELRLAFLRPAALVGHLSAGDTVHLDIFELQVKGPARVLGVDPCPPLEEGAGRLVTGTAVSDSVDVLRLKLVGLAEPLEVTGNHPVFSEDHQDFVSAKVLCVGSRLRTADGAGTVVEAVERLVGRYDVHNLEVDGAHQYYVGAIAVLVHNAGPNGLYEQYSLRASGDGWYPVMERGFQDPQAVTYLKQGEVWKFGTTKNPGTRYSSAWLDGIGQNGSGNVGVNYVTEFSGSGTDAIKLQNMKIGNYELQEGVLPPGNKIRN